MKHTCLALFFLIISINVFSQEENTDKIYDKYLKNGAYKYSYYRPEYQTYIDSALALLPKNAFLWQQKAMPYFKRKKYEVDDVKLHNNIMSLKEEELKLNNSKELLLKEIAQVLGVTESRVSQIHSKALKRIQALLERQFR